MSTEHLTNEQQFDAWYRTQSKLGDPLRNMNLVRDAFYAALDSKSSHIASYEGELNQAALSEAQAYIGELESFAGELQIALSFWLPNVPPQDESDIAKRIGDDAMLLAPWYASTEPSASAEELGIVSLK